MIIPKVSFSEDSYMKFMENLIVNGKKQGESVPKWLFEKLDDKEKGIAYSTLIDLFLAGYKEGMKEKSKEVRELISALNKI